MWRRRLHILTILVIILATFLVLHSVPVLCGDEEDFVSEELSEKLGERLRVEVSQEVVGSEDQWTICIFLNKPGIEYDNSLIGVEWNTSQGFRVRAWRGWNSLVISIQAPLLYKRIVECNSWMDIGEPRRANIPGNLNEEVLRGLRGLGWMVKMGPSSFVDLDYRFVKQDGLEVMIHLETPVERAWRKEVEVWGGMRARGEGYKGLPLDAMEQLSELLESLGLDDLKKKVESETAIRIDYRARKGTMNVTLDALDPQWVLSYDRFYQYYFRNEEIDVQGGLDIWYARAGADYEELHGLFRSQTLVNPKKAEDSLQRLFTSIGLREETLDNFTITQWINFGHVNITASGLDPEKVETAKEQEWDVFINGHSSLHLFTKNFGGGRACLCMGPSPGGDVFLLGEKGLTGGKLDKLIPVLDELLTAINSEVEPYDIIAHAVVEVKVETIIKPTSIVNYVTPSKVVEDMLIGLMKKELIIGLEESDLKAIMGLADWGIKIHYDGTNWGIRTPSLYDRILVYFRGERWFRPPIFTSGKNEYMLAFYREMVPSLFIGVGLYLSLRLIAGYHIDFRTFIDSLNSLDERVKKNIHRIFLIVSLVLAFYGLVMLTGELLYVYKYFKILTSDSWLWILFRTATGIMILYIGVLIFKTVKEFSLEEKMK